MYWNARPNNNRRTGKHSHINILANQAKLVKFLDLRGIEPRPRPCHGRVLPMNYRPALSTQTVYINSNFFQIKIRKGGGSTPLTISSFFLAANSLIKFKIYAEQNLFY